MKYLIIILIAVCSYGGVLDFNYLDKANKAYNKSDFKRASDNYSKVNSDEARYNLANSLYKQKKYKEALNTYESISSKDLEFQKLHNMGNCQAQLKQNDEAIKSYQDALKIKDDKDTKFNLELLKKQKKKEDKKKKQNKKNQKKNDKKNQKDKKKGDKNKQDKKQNKNEKNKDKMKKSQEQKKQNAKKEKQKQKEQSKAKKAKEDKKKQMKKEKLTNKKKKKDNPPISNMEERKWQNMLNQKEINTLLLPIRKGEQKNETKPW